MDRIAALNEILTENPKDAFARYGLAMEYSKQGDFDRALAEFSILLESHPEYTAGYFMAAQTLVQAQRVDEAKKMLNDGIASARRTGNLHAQVGDGSHADGAGIDEVSGSQGFKVARFKGRLQARFRGFLNTWSLRH